MTNLESLHPNIGHGHVFARADGVRARCGGPGIYAECSRDLARHRAGLSRESEPKPRVYTGWLRLENGVEMLGNWVREDEIPAAKPTPTQDPYRPKNTADV